VHIIRLTSSAFIRSYLNENYPRRQQAKLGRRHSRGGVNEGGRKSSLAPNRKDVMAIEVITKVG